MLQSSITSATWRQILTLAVHYWATDRANAEAQAADCVAGNIFCPPSRSKRRYLQEGIVTCEVSQVKNLSGKESVCQCKKTSRDSGSTPGLGR